jgi:nitrile hydratase
MDGIHDLGGREGFGPVTREADEPTFHERWEAAVFAMMFAATRAGATGNADRFRHAIERIDPRAYLDHGYYGRWLGGIETLLVEAGLLDRAALDARARERGAGADDLVAARPAPVPDRPAPPGDESSRRPLAAPARFEVGDPVRTTRHGHSGHTRLPAYVRGCRGTVTAVHGGWVYPDENAHRGGGPARALYTVAFAARELFGPDADPAAEVRLDLFEPYLEAP